jgi:hypothetical protein
MSEKMKPTNYFVLRRVSQNWTSRQLFQMMVDGVNGVPTNPYAAMPQLSGLAEVIVDSGRKATPHQATVGDV